MTVGDFSLRRRAKGFFLPMALVFLVTLLLLEIGLFALQQRASESELQESSRLALLLGTLDVEANTIEALRTSKRSGQIELGRSFNYDVPDSALSLSSTWDSNNSVNNPVMGGWSTFSAISHPADNMPALAFDSPASKRAGQTTVSPGHTLLALKSSYRGHGSDTLSSYTHLFPYGVYAPLGRITANKVTSFTNPSFESADPAKNYEAREITGRPVDLFAAQDVVVTEEYRAGRAISVNGPVLLPTEPDRAGALPISSYPAQPDLGQAFKKEFKSLGESITRGSIDKTELLDDEVFTVEHLRQLFNGELTNLYTFFGVGQACKIPFFPIPGMQNDAPLIIIFYVMCPFPADFAGGSSGKADSERQGEIGTEIREKKAEIAELQEKIDEERAKEKPDEKKIKEWKAEASDLLEEVDALEKEAQQIAQRKDEESKDIAAQLSQAHIPRNAAEDASQRTKGWAYLYMIGNIFNIVMDLISGDNPFKDLVAHTRVVHLGENDPEWKWDSGTIDMKAALSVPQGRTLEINKPNVKVRGDIYLQQGACLRIAGNLTIERPSTWTDFKGASTSASHTIAYPKGRLLMEPGSSLVVSGDLNVTGGTVDEGSIMLVAPYGQNKGMSQLISAGGNVRTKFGMVPGATLGDLIDGLSKHRPALKAFNRDFFQPFVLDMAPQIAKLPGIGPWNKRKSYFADYSTTFEFIPALEIFGLGGPWPIPLPFDNCLNKVFKYVSLAYSVELNFNLGENFYTMSDYWPFGRGISPVVFKTRPDLIEGAIGSLKWEKIAWEALRDEAEKFALEVIPDFALEVFEDVIAEIIVEAISSAIPFKPPSCGDHEKHETESIEDKVRAKLKEILDSLKGELRSSLENVLLRMKNEIYHQLDGDDERFSMMRELPGAVVVAEGSIHIGEADGSRLALGLFVAGGDVIIGCERTVGSIVSLEGSVTVEELYHYPYYDRASFYSPKKYGNQGLVPSLVNFEMPEGGLGGDVNPVFPRRLAQGWK